MPMWLGKCSETKRSSPYYSKNCTNLSTPDVKSKFFSPLFFIFDVQLFYQQRSKTRFERINYSNFQFTETKITYCFFCTIFFFIQI
ncbi:hypothetical protein PUN28_001344 [Cardiocondyla obscurior]|uniref:Uncharacterized protein n=1 Tax=Cardiocondyla obscurior TaxID=286306 RepID=A0AAW2H4U6_9HYME